MSFIMKKKLITSAISQIKLNLQEASYGYEILQGTRLSTEEFLKVAKILWLNGELSGAVNDGCCQNGCGNFCVSYLKLDRQWLLITR